MVRHSEYSTAIIRHMLFTLFLVFHENEKNDMALCLQNTVYAVGKWDREMNERMTTTISTYWHFIPSKCLKAKRELPG